MLSTNLFAITCASIGGALSLALLSAIIISVTGLQLGLSIYLAFITDLKLTLLIFQHGIIEMTGLLLAASLGFRPLFIVYKYLKGDKDALSDYLSRGAIVKTLSLYFFSFSLISIAAFIESFLTGGIIVRHLV